MEMFISSPFESNTSSFSVVEPGENEGPLKSERWGSSLGQMSVSLAIRWQPVWMAEGFGAPQSTPSARIERENCQLLNVHGESTTQPTD